MFLCVQVRLENKVHVNDIICIVRLDTSTVLRAVCNVCNCQWVRTAFELCIFFKCTFIAEFYAHTVIFLHLVCIPLLSETVSFLNLYSSPNWEVCCGILHHREQTAETLKSGLIFFQLMLCCVPVPAGGYFKLARNGTANSWGLIRSCHSQCLRPLSLRCQALEDCHGYPQSVCHPP